VPRIRTIKPETAEDEKLGEVSRDARLLFILVWTMCDDHGRFRASNVWLRNRLFGYDNVTPATVGGWLEELVAIGRVRVYEVDGERYGLVVNWARHQRVDNAGKSLYPDPPPNAPDPPREPAHLPTPEADNGESPRDSAGHGEPPLDLDLGPGPGPGPRTTTARAVALREPPPLAIVPSNGSSPPATVTADDEFAIWWEHYPRKVGKPSALKAWRRARKAGATLDELATGLDAWKRAWTAQRRPSDMLPHASTWLNDRRWEDPPDMPTRARAEPKGFAGIRAAAGLDPA
jgi:hypothetical protein